MTAVIIIAGVLAFILLILLVPVSIRIVFAGQLTVRARILFVPIKLYPKPPPTPKQLRKEQKKEQRKKLKEAQKKKKKRRKARKPEEALSLWEQLLRQDGVSGVIEYCAELARLLGKALKRVLRAITVDKLQLQILVASEDAAKTAVDYGRVCAAVYPTLALLGSAVRVRKQRIQMTPDFLKESSEVTAHIRLHIIPLRILWALILLFAGYVGNTISNKSTDHSHHQEKGLTEKR